MVKKLLAFALALAIMLVSTVTAFAAEAPAGHEGLWYDDDSECYYYYENGEKVTEDYRTVGGNRYYFDWWGESEVGGFVDSNGEAHFATEDSIVVTGADLGLAGGKGWYYFDDYDEWYYFYADGTIAHEEFVDIGGNTYYFDYWCEMVTGIFDHQKYVEDEGWVNYYYVTDNNGAIIKTPGWYKHIEKHSYISWCYISDNTGALLNGFQTIGGKDYYFISGEMIEGVFLVYDEETHQDVYYFAKQGGELTNKPGWYNVVYTYYDGDTYDNWYYINADGEIARDDFYKIDGKTYYFDSWGCLWVGTFSIDYWDDEGETYITKCYVADYNGVVATTPSWAYVKTFKNYSPNYFYVLEDGTVATDCIRNIDGYDYHFDSQGYLSIGRFWNDEINDYSMADDTGKIMNKGNSWYKSDGDWYYLKEDCTFPCDELLVVDGKKYLFDYAGRMVIGRYTIDNVTYYTDESGALYKNKRIQDYFDWYYVKADGTLAREEWINDTYYFNYNGVMAVGTEYTADYGYCVFDSNGKYVTRAGKVKGWQWLDGYWYYYDKVGVPHDGWLKSGGAYYYFDNGQMRTDSGVWDEEYNEYYYVDKTGKMKVNGWVQDTYYGDWYYADASGALATGWTKISGKWYYFYEYASMCNSEIVYLYDEEKWHKFNSSGAWICELTDKKWVQDSMGDWYYITPGETIYDRYDINGTTYYFQNNRMCANQSYDGYWLDANGKIDMGSGWRKSRYGSWYYLEKGELADGLRKIGGKWYNFDYAMSIGYVEYWDTETNNYAYGFFGSDGAWQKIGTGWYSINRNYYGENYTTWYYFKNGKPLDNGDDYREYHTIGGKKYLLYSDGEMYTGAYYSDNGNRYIFDQNGQLSKGGWVKVDGNWYYTDSTGRAYTGEHKIGGKTYYFNYRGVMI